MTMRPANDGPSAEAPLGRAHAGHRMRVLMTTDAVGGVWTYSLDLAAGLAAHDVDVVLAAIGPGPSATQRRAAALAGIQLETAPYRLEWMDDPWDDVAAAGDWLCDLEERLDCDLVHLNGYSYGSFPFERPRVVVGHSCVLSWWHAVRGAAPPPEWNLYRRRVGAGLAAASHVVAPSRWMRGELQRHYGLGGDISVIHNGRPARAFTSAAKRPFVFASGRVWDEAKNLRALARVSRQVPWPIRIAGALGLAGGAAGSTTIGLEDLSGVDLLGTLSGEEMAELYAAAPIYTLPARYEPFGLSALEAALSGCALVLGDIPSLRELWDGAALFVDPNDDDMLVRALRRLIDEPDGRTALADRARVRARRSSRHRMASAYARLYSHLLNWPAPDRTVARKEQPCVS